MRKIQCDSVWFNANIATMQGAKYNVIDNGFVAVEGGRIVAIGTESEINSVQAKHKFDVAKKWIIPAMIDCHTHVVFGGNRSDEFEARLKGVSYIDISKSGGGILSTVRATRELSHEHLYKQSLPRVMSLIKEGVTTIEIKSGYGLNYETEKKILEVANQISEQLGIKVLKTFLGAHSIPPEFKDNADAYVDEVISMMDKLNDEGLIDAVDGFCENIAFSRQQIEKIFKAAKNLNLDVKLHAEQLSNQNGASLVAKYKGLSADHIEYLCDEDIELMKINNTAAVLLPGAFYMLNETQKPPVEKLRQAGINIALASDCNPGTSPIASLLLSMNMACTLFSLTPEEALAGVTIQAAKALNIDKDYGVIAKGYKANFNIYNIDRPADLSYFIGIDSCYDRIVEGQKLNLSTIEL